MRILLTAFDPYDDWSENSSWLTMVDLLSELPQSMELVTRRYPVDLPAMRERLEQDLTQDFDAILHLGQSPGTASLKLESVALNVAGYVQQKGEELTRLVADGPLAYQSTMPLGQWASLLRNENVPAVVSYHAGTFLCNALMYLSHHWFRNREDAPAIGFVHLPLTTRQVAARGRNLASLPTSVMSHGVRLILDALAREPSRFGKLA